jgi:hypothetical protein
LQVTTSITKTAGRTKIIYDNLLVFIWTALGKPDKSESGDKIHIQILQKEKIHNKLNSTVWEAFGIKIIFTNKEFCVALIKPTFLLHRPQLYKFCVVNVIQ